MLPVAIPLLVFGVGGLAGRALLRPSASGRKAGIEPAGAAAPSSKYLPDKGLNSSASSSLVVATPQEGGLAVVASQNAAPAQPAPPQVGSPALCSSASPPGAAASPLDTA